MTIKYINDVGAIITDSTVTKIEPIQNGVNFLLTTTSDIIIPIRNLVEITNA